MGQSATWWQKIIWISNIGRCTSWFILDYYSQTSRWVWQTFSNFDALLVSKYTQKHIKNLLKDSSIVRNKLKIVSAINNAKQFLKVQDDFGSFDSYLWDLWISNSFSTNSKNHLIFLHPLKFHTNLVKISKNTDLLLLGLQFVMR